MEWTTILFINSGRIIEGLNDTTCVFGWVVRWYTLAKVTILFLITGRESEIIIIVHETYF